MLEGERRARDPPAALADAAPRNRRDRAGEGVVVDRDDARAEAPCELLRLADVRRPDAGGEAVARCVRAPEGLLDVGDRRDRNDRAEGLVGDELIVVGIDPHDRRSIAERRRLRIDSFAAFEDLGARSARGVDVTLDDASLRVRGERPDVFAEAERLRRRNDLGGEGVGDMLFDVHALDGTAVLTGVHHRAPNDAVRGAFEIGVGQDDGGVLSAELDGARDEPLGTRMRDLTTRLRAACEYDEVDVRVDEARADVSPALDDAHESVGDEPIEELGDELARARGDLARLEDDRVAGHQRRHDRAEREREREVPRHDDGDRPARIAMHPASLLRVRERVDLRLERLELLRDDVRPVADDIRAREDLAEERFDIGLARLVMDELRDGLGALEDPLLDRADGLHSLRDRDGRPPVLRLAGTPHHAGDVLERGRFDGAEVLARRRALRREYRCRSVRLRRVRVEVHEERRRL